MRYFLLIVLGLAVGAFCFRPASVLAQDVDPDINRYVEPTLNSVDGTGLEDLESCTVTVTDPYTGAEASATFPASSPAGGATIPYSVTEILGSAPEGPKPYPQIAYCSDTKGNTSVASNALDSKFPPVPPMAPVLLKGPAGP
jgi:hypothetical protein